MWHNNSRQKRCRKSSGISKPEADGPAVFIHHFVLQNRRAGKTFLSKIPEAVGPASQKSNDVLRKRRSLHPEAVGPAKNKSKVQQVLKNSKAEVPEADGPAFLCNKKTCSKRHRGAKAQPPRKRKIDNEGEKKTSK